MICHIDADAFFASVLQRLHPHLKGKALIATGMGGGCVIAASYPAKAKGVKTGMRIKEARILCSEATILPSNFRETGLASQQIEAILKDRCPLVQAMSIDEWFLHLPALTGGTPTDLTAWARDMQRHIIQATDIGVSIGIATSKTLAKMAGEERKPRGITVLHDQAEITAFLQRRPAAAIAGIGSSRQQDCQMQGWDTAWDIANAPTALIERLWGKGGKELQQELCGVPMSPVAEDTRPPQSISRTRSFPPSSDTTILWAHALKHLSICILKMRRHHLATHRISVWLRDSSYHGGDEASRRLPRLFDVEQDLIPFVRHCFLEAKKPGKRYTQVGLALSELTLGGTTQYSLFRTPENTKRMQNLQECLDVLRTRYGKDIVLPGGAMPVMDHERPGLEITMID